MKQAGIEGRWSGRSLRRGFISTAADLGLRLEDIAKGSRHQTMESLIRYIATDDPFRNNPGVPDGVDGARRNSPVMLIESPHPGRWSL